MQVAQPQIPTHRAHRKPLKPLQIQNAHQTVTENNYTVTVASHRVDIHETATYNCIVGNTYIYTDLSVLFAFAVTTVATWHAAGERSAMRISHKMRCRLSRFISECDSR